MATDNKITKRDNYNTLRDMVALDSTLSNEEQDRLLAFIDHELELMSQRAEKSKKYQKEHKAESDAMTDLIIDTLANADTALSVADIVGKITDGTPQKIVYRLGTLFKAGRITKDTRTIKTEGAPARRVTYYALAVDTDVE